MEKVTRRTLFAGVAGLPIAKQLAPNNAAAKAGSGEFIEVRTREDLRIGDLVTFIAGTGKGTMRRVVGYNYNSGTVRLGSALRF